MKFEPDEKRLKELQDVYRSLGLNSEQLGYFASLEGLARQAEPEHPIVLITETTSDSAGELEDAKLD